MIPSITEWKVLRKVMPPISGHFPGSRVQSHQIPGTILLALPMPDFPGPQQNGVKLPHLSSAKCFFQTGWRTGFSSFLQWGDCKYGEEMTKSIFLATGDTSLSRFRCCRNFLSRSSNFPQPRSFEDFRGCWIEGLPFLKSSSWESHPVKTGFSQNFGEIRKR